MGRDPEPGGFADRPDSQGEGSTAKSVEPAARIMTGGDQHGAKADHRRGGDDLVPEGAASVAGKLGPDGIVGKIALRGSARRGTTHLTAPCLAVWVVPFVSRNKARRLWRAPRFRFSGRGLLALLVGGGEHPFQGGDRHAQRAADVDRRNSFARRWRSRSPAESATPPPGAGLRACKFGGCCRRSPARRRAHGRARRSA
jgi:hypothetical protein